MGAVPSLPHFAGSAVPVEAAGAFLRWHAATLQQALLHPADAVLVATVIGLLGAAHPDWVVLIGSLARVGATEAATAVTDLYATTGRAVGVLERRPDVADGLPNPSMLRRSLVAQLGVRAEAAVLALAATRPPPAQ